MQQLFLLKSAKVKVDGLSALVEGKSKLFTQIMEGKDIKTIAGLDYIQNAEVLLLLKRSVSIFESLYLFLLNFASIKFCEKP